LLLLFFSYCLGGKLILQFEKHNKSNVKTQELTNLLSMAPDSSNYDGRSAENENCNLGYITNFNIVNTAKMRTISHIRV